MDFSFYNINVLLRLIDGESAEDDPVVDDEPMFSFFRSSAKKDKVKVKGLKFRNKVFCEDEQT